MHALTLDAMVAPLQTFMKAIPLPPLTVSDIDTILGVPLSNGLVSVLNERRSHARRGYDAAHDDGHGVRELVGYVTPYLSEFYSWCPMNPADPEWAAPTKRARTQLVKAASVLLAAIELLDRKIATRGEN